MSAHLEIRTADLGERGRLEQLQLRASLVWARDREALRSHPDAVAIGSSAIEEGRVRVLERDGEVLGFSERSRLSAREWELEGLFVDPEALRSGHGTRLLIDLYELAHDEGVRWISVTANPGAVPFYEARGFERRGEVRTRFGPALRMRVDLRR